MTEETINPLKKHGDILIIINKNMAYYYYIREESVKSERVSDPEAYYKNIVYDKYGKLEKYKVSGIYKEEDKIGVIRVGNELKLNRNFVLSLLRKSGIDDPNVIEELAYIITPKRKISYYSNARTTISSTKKRY